MSPHRRPDGRVLLVVPYDYLAVSPMLMNTLTLLARRGIGVDLLMQRSLHQRPAPPLPASVEAHRFTPDARATVPITFQFARWCSRFAAARHYDLAIGVDPHGIIAAAWATRVRAVPIVYFSLEFLMDGRPVLARILRRLETMAARRSVLIVCPGRDRAEYLQSQLKVPMGRFFVLPNSRLGAGAFVRSAFLHERLGIPVGRRVLLQAGGIAPWNLSLELARAALSWPEDQVLVLHGFAYEEAYLERIRDLTASGRVHLSLHLLPLEELDRVVSSADVGLVFYSTEEANHRYWSLSSGKLADSLKCGVPVITSHSPAVARLLSTYRCGVCVADPDEVGAAAAGMWPEYQAWSDGALRCYATEFDFEDAFDELCARLALPGTGSGSTTHIGVAGL